MYAGQRSETTFGLVVTIVYGVLFSLIQGYEYQQATFSINDGAYTSVFYMLTGFHGLHVFIGTVFLLICLIRHKNYQFFKKHHIGFACAI
jgi:heme/copper-type cytochrome/quinol oxidase subunit 3